MGNASPDSGHDLKVCILAGIAVAVLTLAIYGQTIRHAFIPVDDELYITGNRFVQGGLTSDGLRYAFTSLDAANWHPVTWLSLMADVQLFGVDPGKHHAVNLGFHLANSLLLFLVLFRMTGACPQSAFVAAAFALHPVHVESVAWISERKDLVSAFFFLLLLRSWTAWKQAGSKAAWLVALLCLASGLMAKPMLVTAPFILLLLDYWPFAGSAGSRRPGDAEGAPSLLSRLPLLREKIPFFLLAIASSVITIVAQARGGAIQPYGFGVRFANAVRAYALYLRDALVPARLGPFHPHPGPTIAAWETVAGSLLVLGVSLLALRCGRRRGWLPVGWFWFLGALVPVIGIIQVGKQAMADRYMYLPSIGLFMVVAWGGAEVLGRIRWRAIRIALPALCLLSMSAIAWRQAGFWKDEFTLYSRALAVDPGNAFVHQNMGVLLNEAGNHPAALRHFQEAVRIEPENPKYAVNLGVTLRRMGKPDAAEMVFREVVRGAPGYAPAHTELGRIFALKGKRREAVAELRESLRLSPGDVNAHKVLGTELADAGSLQEAIDHMLFAARNSGADPDAWFILGRLLDRAGRFREAVPCYLNALSIRSPHIPSSIGLAVDLARTGNADEAVRMMREIVEKMPADASAREALASVLEAAGSGK
jgi:Flp pilus assembly protein TadD